MMNTNSSLVWAAQKINAASLLIEKLFVTLPKLPQHTHFSLVLYRMTCYMSNWASRLLNNRVLMLLKRFEILNYFSKTIFPGMSDWCSGFSTAAVWIPQQQTLYGKILLLGSLLGRFVFSFINTQLIYFQDCAILSNFKEKKKKLKYFW